MGARKPPMMTGFQAEENLTGRAQKNVRKILDVINHHPRTIDRHLYKERHLIETFFNKIKEYRKIATRYDKLAEVFAAFVCLAASLIWLR